MRRTTVVLALLLAACGGTEPFDPASVAGEYTLTAVNGQPLPFVLVDSMDFALYSATISLRPNQTYTARTCYTANCSISRPEFGRFELHAGRVVALSSGDGYGRELTAVGSQLVQRGGGDFVCPDSASRANGRVCYTLTYAR